MEKNGGPMEMKKKTTKVVNFIKEMTHSGLLLLLWADWLAMDEHIDHAIQGCVFKNTLQMHGLSLYNVQICSMKLERIDFTKRLPQRFRNKRSVCW